MTILKVLVGLILPIIVGIILFIINPLLGVLWTIWMVILVIYALRKDLIMKFLGWLFGEKKN